MRAVTFNVTIPSYLVGKTLGRVTDAALYGGLSGVRFRDIAEPDLPGKDWVRLEILKAGICGSDIGNLTLTSSPAMEPFGSFPAVLGHEILARVAEVGPDVRRVEVGQRVVKGEHIALLGSTGRSTGYHVHFEVLRNGRRVNPMTYIRAGDKAPTS